MRYRTLHGTDIKVSELGFGTWTLTTGWWGTYTDDQARAIIASAVRRGINYLDTADAYGNGRGESVLAPLLKEHPELVIGAHVTGLLRRRANARQFSFRHLASLRRLRSRPEVNSR